MAEVDHTLSLALKDADIQQIKQASLSDPTFVTLREVIRNGWPLNKKEVPERVQAYFDVRDELTIQQELIFKGQRLVVPVSMRRNMMITVHSTHIGIESCLRRARDSIYWPCMTTELKDCDICLAYRQTPSKEPLQQHEFTERPWSKVGIDLCDFHGRTLLVLVDYHSNFIEVERITSLTTSGVSKVLMTMFSRYGVPDQVMSDNGPQFSSSEFRSFATKWGFEHITASPRYPQSNGKVENAVKTVKLLFNKCKDSGQSEYKALLDWRNTPSEGIGASPAQRFLGRRCRTLLPATNSLLQPQFSIQEYTQQLNKQKKRQQYYYNKHAHPLKPIMVGEPVLMRLPGHTKWSQGECTGLVGPRSYEVTIGSNKYRRNRKQLIVAGSLPREDHLPSETMRMPQPESQPAGSECSSQTDDMEITEVPTTTAVPTTPATSVSNDDVAVPRRSGRSTRPPSWMADYIPSESVI